MQTFLVYPSFPHAVAVLDQRRLGKQRVENLQILNTLRRTRTEPLTAETPHTVAAMLDDGRKTGWRNHPAVRMWRGYEPALALYQTFTIREWLARGYQNNIPVPYDEGWQVNQEAEAYCGPLPPVDAIQLPEWVGENLIHATHRSRLLAKDETWYSQFGWHEGPGLEYMWPDQIGIEAPLEALA